MNGNVNNVNSNKKIRSRKDLQFKAPKIKPKFLIKRKIITIYLSQKICSRGGRTPSG
jgi:hypothetical protein